MKVTERQPIQSGGVKWVQVGTRTTVTCTECTEADAGVGGREVEFLVERAACDYPDHAMSEVTHAYKKLT